MLIYNDNDGLYTVYLIINNLNSKKYIGVHKEQPDEDLYSYMGSGKAITTAVKKYGVENFTKVILARFDTREPMVTMEEQLVTQDIVESKEYYNMRTGGDHGLLSEEQREKLSAALKGKPRRPLSEEHRANISAALKGKPVSEERRANMKGRSLSEEHREKISAAQKGVPKSKKVREKRKGKPLSKETREKISSTLKGKPKSKEHRENMSVVRKGKPLSKETRKKLSVVMTGRTHNEETRAKISAAQKGKKRGPLSKETQLDSKSQTP